MATTSNTPTLYGPTGLPVTGPATATPAAPTPTAQPVGRVRAVRHAPAGLPPLHGNAVYVGPPWPGRRYNAPTKAAYVVATYYKVGATVTAIVQAAASNPHPTWGNLAAYTAACLQYDYANNPNAFTL